MSKRGGSSSADSGKRTSSIQGAGTGAAPAPVTGQSLEGSLDYERLHAATEAVLAEPLYWFPVRHHSPNVARHLRAALLARKPKVVFLEAPASAQSGRAS